MIAINEFENRLTAGLSAAGVEPRRRLLVAVSGGPDSMSLLAGLLNLKEARPEDAPGIVAAHFNHRLRGPESEGDARYVSDFCAERGVELVLGTGDVNEYRAERGLSMEVAARRLRYDFLAHAVIEHGAQAVATGHTLDDQAETVLLHATRGSGLQGIAAMRPRTELPRSSGTKLTVVRPMLALRRSDTESYCTDRELRPRHDSSNTDVSIPRNLIRHKVLPELEHVNPNAPSALARLAEIVAVDVEWLEHETQVAWARIASMEIEGTVSIDRTSLANLHRAISSRILMQAHQVVSGGADESLAAVHVGAILALLDGGTGTELSLPGDTEAKLTYDALLISPVGAAVSSGDCPYPDWAGQVMLQVPGSIRIGENHDLVASEVAPPSEPVAHCASVAYLDMDVTGREFLVRGRKNGDRFQPLGMDGEKKIQDFFVDEQIPREWRDRVPLVESLADGRGIAWVAGHRPAHWARVTPETKSAIRVELVSRVDKS